MQVAMMCRQGQWACVVVQRFAAGSVMHTISAPSHSSAHVAQVAKACA
jgi:hypothetical protein